MARTRVTNRRPTKRARGALVCPECGFKAAHVMGLGRHRSARHGVPSKRELMRRGARVSASRRADFTSLAKRLEALEERHNRLMKALARALKEGRR